MRLRTPSIFISYRREDTADLSSLLARDLKEDLGLSNVFRDSDDLRAGLEFPVEIEQRVVESNVTVALIGSAWAGHGDARRLNEPGDWVRREIRVTFESGGDLIPVLVDGAQLPASLPDDVSRLSSIQSLELDSENYDPAYQELLASVWYLNVRTGSEREVMIISDDTAEARLAVDELVETLDAEDTPGARALSRVAVGLRAVSVGDAAKRWPDVIILTDDAPSETQLQRLRGIASHKRIRQIGFVAAAATVGAGGLAIGKGGFARAESIASEAGNFTSSVSFDSTHALASWVRPNRFLSWWQGLGTAGNVGVVAGTVAAIAVGVTLVSSDPEPAPRPPGGEAVARIASTTQPLPAAVPTTAPEPADDELPDVVAAEIETEKPSDDETCTLTLQGTNDDPDIDGAEQVAVEVGDTLTVCATGFLPFDVPLAVTALDGPAWDPATLALSPGGGDVQPWEVGGGWEPVAFAVLPGASLGPHVVTAEVALADLQEAAFALTAAKTAGADDVATGGKVAIALVEIVEATGPQVTVSPQAGPPGTEFTVGLAGFGPNSDEVVHIYAHTGSVGADPPRETWQYVTTLTAVTGDHGEAILAFVSLPEDPVGRYLLVVSEEQYAEYELE